MQKTSEEEAMSLQDRLEAHDEETIAWTVGVMCDQPLSKPSDHALLSGIDFMERRLEQLQAEAFRRGLVRK